MKPSIGFGAIFFMLLLFRSHFRCVCVARDTITVANLLSEEHNETLVSAGRKFELGFFTPEGSIDGGRYVGIWYYSNISLPRTVVWVANRDNPMPRNALPGVLAIIEDGNLKVLDGEGTVYFTAVLQSSLVDNPTVKLLDSGNLALIDGRSGAYSWQSFAHPTDTFLPGMLMDDNLKLVSWVSPSEPKSGNYTFQIDQEDKKQFRLMKRLVLHWKSDQSGGFIPSIEMPHDVAALLSNFSASMNYSYKSSKAANSIPYFGKQLLTNPSAFNYSADLALFANTRLLMNSSGEIQFCSWNYQNGSSLLWSEPHDPCSIYNPCGNFGICSNRNGSLTCECLPGFQPDSLDNWNSGEFSTGCVRKSSICNKNKKPDTFLNLKLMKVGSKYSTFPEGVDEMKCRKECLDTCECQAYYYVGLNGRSGTKNAGANCLIWTTDLSNLQKEYQYTDGIQNFSISIRVAASDIESTTRDCESCGQNLLPYPLSSGSNCGDPSYQSFHCDIYTGQLQFLTLNGSYEVVSINKDENTLVIRSDGAGNAADCSAEDPASRVLTLNQSLPFDVTNWCYNASAKGERKMQISWSPPPEPLCNSSDNCTLDWPNSVCNATADGMRRCLCIHKYRWDGRNLNCTSVVGAPAKQSEQSKHVTKLTVSITVVAVVLLAGSISCFYFRRRILLKRKETKGIILGNPLGYPDDSERRAQDLVVEGNKAIDVPFFSLESILAATDNFSNTNKLGQGGFGPVYKIILGITRGLLYLHRDSRLRVIHRDLKTSNILLDEELNPKISDFGLARIVGGKETEANTEKVVGTYGYMSPEYALEGSFSKKSDVYSFGVILLEIISGKRNIGFCEGLSLLGYAWKLWQERKPMEFIDKKLLESCQVSVSEVLKCIIVGLLCVQEDPVDRPTMANVLIMLGSETATLPSPNQPAFVSRKRPDSNISGSSSSKPDSNSVNEITVSLVEGR